MRISTRSRYGLRAMIDIARKPNEPTTCEEIADCESVSKKYLDGILGRLRRAGLVRSVKGQGGGYMLARSAREISVRDILRPLEPIPDVVPCVGDPSRCERSRGCPAREVWRTASYSLDLTLGAIKLADLAVWKPGRRLAGIGERILANMGKDSSR